MTMKIIRSQTEAESLQEFCDRNDITLLLHQEPGGCIYASLEGCRVIVKPDSYLSNSKDMEYIYPATGKGGTEEEAIDSLCDIISLSDMFVWKGFSDYQRVCVGPVAYTGGIEKEEPPKPLPSPAHLIQERIPGIENLIAQTNRIVEFDVPKLSENVRFQAVRSNVCDDISVREIGQNGFGFTKSPVTQFLESLLNMKRDQGEPKL